MNVNSFLRRNVLALFLGIVLAGAAMGTVPGNGNDLKTSISLPTQRASGDFWPNSIPGDGGTLFPSSDRLKPTMSTEGVTPSLFPTFDQLRRAFQSTEKRKPWFQRHWLAACFFIFLSVYLVAMIGVSGGPNHGEHPLILNIGHLILLSMYGGHWASAYYTAYQNLLLAAAGLSLLAFLLRITLVAWVIRIGMTGIYGGLFCLLHLKDGPF